MLERLKQPFWFGLPLYAWLAGGAALVLGVGYFAFFAKGQAAVTPQTDSSPTDPLNPFPDTNPGAGATVPPAAAFAPAGTVVYTQPSASMLQPAQAISTPTTQGMAGVIPPSRVVSASTVYRAPNVQTSGTPSTFIGQILSAVGINPTPSTAGPQRTGPQSQ